MTQEASMYGVEKQDLLSPKTSVLFQKRHLYTRNLNLKTSGDSEKRVSILWRCSRSAIAVVTTVALSVRVTC